MGTAPEWIRTTDLPLRRRLLYPTELRALGAGEVGSPCSCGSISLNGVKFKPDTAVGVRFDGAKRDYGFDSRSHRP